MDNPKTFTSTRSDVYYSGTYWNDLDNVLRYMSTNFTGVEKRLWVDDFKEMYAIKPFKHALFLNCGDGHVKREFVDRK